MKPLDFNSLQTTIDDQIKLYYGNKLALLSTVTLESLLQNNPYLLMAQTNGSADNIITKLVNASTSKLDEKLFNNLLKTVALIVAEQTCDGRKSVAQGVDLEFVNHNTLYVVSIKSGPNWGNSSQHRRLAQDLRDAVTRVRQQRTPFGVQPVLGICYGRVRTVFSTDGYLKVVGQNFWYLISEDPDLFTDIIEPIGYRAKEHNEEFDEGRAALQNKLTGQFITAFCDPTGAIDWTKVVQANSMNLDLSNFLPIG